MEDDDQIIEVLRAGRAVLARIQEMPGSQARADAATHLARGLRSIADDASAVLHEEAVRIYYEEHLTFGQVAKRLGISKTLAHQIITANRRDEQAAPEPTTKPEPGPVVVAIVTSHLGVLVGRRTDGRPPWTFIVGKMEPGESSADAAVREVKEETGLRVRAGGRIGTRVHPKTGRTLVYLAAQPTHGTDVIVGDEEDLAEVRWVGLREADELMGHAIYEAVRQHLSRTLGEG